MVPRPATVSWRFTQFILDELLEHRDLKGKAIVTILTESDSFSMQMAATSNISFDKVIISPDAQTSAQADLHQGDKSPEETLKYEGREVDGQKYYPLFTARTLERLGHITGRHTACLSEALTIR